MMRIAGTVMLIATTLAGCASTPASIDPAYVSSVPYEGYTCEQIATEVATIEPQLLALAEEQQSRRNADFASGILIGLTPTMFSGDDRAAAISSMRGQLVTLRQVGGAKACPLPPEDPKLTSILDPTPMNERVR